MRFEGGGERRERGQVSHKLSRSLLFPLMFRNNHRQVARDGESHALHVLSLLCLQNQYECLVYVEFMESRLHEFTGQKSNCDPKFCSFVMAKMQK